MNIFLFPARLVSSGAGDAFGVTPYAFPIQRAIRFMADQRAYLCTLVVVKASKRKFYIA